jgi:hypothetical protein
LRKDVELVMIAGRVQLATEATLEWPPFTAKRRLKPAMSDRFIRWLRALVNTSVQKLKEAPGKAEIRPGCRNIRFLAGVEADNGR